MKKLLLLGMKRFSTIPVSLRADPSVDEHAKEIEVDFREVCHQLTIDNQGEAYADEAGLEFDLYSRRLLPDKYVKFRESGLSRTSQGKGSYHALFGAAFCRWFLYKHFSITYFAELKPLIGRPLGSEFFLPSLIRRVLEGDTPDYLCARSDRVSFLAEAKGSMYSMPFDGKVFHKAREQFTRVEVLYGHSGPIQTKGYIVATRFANQDHTRVKSRLNAEDPETKGTSEYQEGPSTALYEAALRGHYAAVLDTLRFPLYAHSLREWFLLPPEHKIQVGLWTALIPPINGKRFVGGIFPSRRWRYYAPWNWEWDRLDLSRPNGTFFGLELEMFLNVRQLSMRGSKAVDDIYEFEAEREPAGGFTLLRDGTLMAPIDYVRFDGFREI